MAPFLGDFSQSERLFEIKLPLAVKLFIGIAKAPETTTKYNFLSLIFLNLFLNSKLLGRLNVFVDYHFGRNLKVKDVNCSCRSNR